MLLDEPFAGIDPIAVGDIQNLVRHLTRRGIGVLITDHNVRETLGLIDRAYIIHSGRVLTEGQPGRDRRQRGRPPPLSRRGFPALASGSQQERRHPRSATYDARRKRFDLRRRLALEQERHARSMPIGGLFARGVPMGLMQRLELRQGQSLVMTPQLLQAIKLLQLSHLDLAAYVEAELERNPLLERPERATTARRPRLRRSTARAMAEDSTTPTGSPTTRLESRRTELDEPARAGSTTFSRTNPVPRPANAGDRAIRSAGGLAVEPGGGSGGFDGDGARFRGDPRRARRVLHEHLVAPARPRHRAIRWSGSSDAT